MFIYLWRLLNLLVKLLNCVYSNLKNLTSLLPFSQLVVYPSLSARELLQTSLLTSAYIQYRDETLRVWKQHNLHLVPR